MLENPENKVWLDADTIVATSDRQAAIRRCRELAEYNELRGQGAALSAVSFSIKVVSHTAVFLNGK